MESHVPKLVQRLAVALRGDALRTRAIKSAIWTVGGIMTSQILRLISNLILTRILFPEAFGTMALVLVFITGLAMFSDLGIHTSIIQNDRSREPAFLNTAWTLQIIRGGILWVLTYALATPVATFYNEPLLALLLPVAALTAVIDGFMPTRMATANRDLVIGRITSIDIASQIAGLVITIFLAWLLHSVWALVIGIVLGRIVRQTLLMIALPGHRNRLQIERVSLAELVHFGKWIFLSTAFGFLVNNADKAVLGKFITLEMLGIYSIAFSLANIPLLLGRPLAGKIVFPLYKQRPPWESAVNQIKIFRMRRILTGALISISATLALAGIPLIAFLYDERYALAGPILVIIVISQLPLVILSSYDQILLAAGDSKRFMMRLATNALTQTGLLLLGVVNFGLVGALLAPGLAALVVYPVLISAVRRYNAWDISHDLIYGAIALSIATITIWANYDAVSVLLVRTMP